MTTATPTPSSPAAPGLRLQCDRSGPTLTAYLDGDLDITTSAVALDVIDRITDDTTRVVLDLSGLSFCDSSGLGVFVQIHRRAEDVGAEFNLYQVTPALREVLAVTGLDQVLPTRC
jgi:anti-anti-sigma factor